MTKIERMILHYKGGDGIYVDKIDDLKRYDLSLVEAITVTEIMSVAEYKERYAPINSRVDAQWPPLTDRSDGEKRP